MIDYVYVSNTLDDEKPQASRRVVNTILESDMIVLGPGSLFTSILPNIVIEEIGQALLETKAEVAYVCNIMTQRWRNMKRFTDSDHVESCRDILVDLLLILSWFNIEKVPREYMDTNLFDEYLVQVEHDFAGLCKQVHV